MKINWKVAVSVVVMVVALVWAVTSLLPHSFSGTNLTFGVGSGTVTVNNLSDLAIPVQLIGTGSRVFTVGSSIEGIAGSSTRQGSGSSSTQLFEYASPPGKSDFIVTKGANVKFVANNETGLEATVQPLNNEEVRSTLILAAVAICAALFYASQSTGHRWLRSLRRREVPVLATEAAAATPANGDPNRGRDGRMYSNFGNKD